MGQLRAQGHGGNWPQSRITGQNSAKSPHLEPNTIFSSISPPWVPGIHIEQLYETRALKIKQFLRTGTAGIEKWDTILFSDQHSINSWTWKRQPGLFYIAHISFLRSPAEKRRALQSLNHFQHCLICERTEWFSSPLPRNISLLH